MCVGSSHIYIYICIYVSMVWYSLFTLKNVFCTVTFRAVLIFTLKRNENLWCDVMFQHFTGCWQLYPQYRLNHISCCWKVPKTYYSLCLASVVMQFVQSCDKLPNHLSLFTVSLQVFHQQAHLMWPRLLMSLSWRGRW